MSYTGFTIEQLTRLEAAIAEGALKVRDGDRELTYNSLTEMRALRDSMRAELGLTGPTNGARVGFATYGKGL